jgi:hypothetical protein
MALQHTRVPLLVVSVSSCVSCVYLVYPGGETDNSLQARTQDGQWILSKALVLPLSG